MKLLRKKLMLTQQQVAERIGVKQEYISKLEHGQIDGLKIGRLKRIAKVYKVCPAELLRLLIQCKCKNRCNHKEEIENESCYLRPS